MGELLPSESHQKPSDVDRSKAEGVAQHTNVITISPGRLPLQAQARRLDASQQDVNQPRLNPPELVSRAMESPDGHALPGRSMSLLEALEFADTQQQLEVTHAYWQLVSGVAHYNLRCRLLRMLDIAGVAPADLSELKTAQAAAAAALTEARCEAVSAQYDLAQTAMLPPGTELPLPVDMPHVGTYHTHFAQIFSRRPAPPAARLIDRVLPIYCKAIDQRGLAVDAARRAFDAARDDYRSGRTGIDAVVARAASLVQQQVALVDCVCNYNHEIVEYAVASLPQPVAAASLVSMLIKSTAHRPEQFDDGRTTATAAHPLRNQPTLAPPRGSVRRLSHEEPASSTSLPVMFPEAIPRQNPLRDKSRDESRLQDPIRNVPKTTPDAAEPLQLDTTLRSTKQLTPGNDEQSRRTMQLVLKPFEHYADSADAEAADRVVRLVNALHAESAPAAVAEGRIELADYIELGRSGDRMDMIEAFWLARRRAAEYQSLVRQDRLLEQLQIVCGCGPMATQSTSARSAAARSAVERLGAARQATKAEMIDADIRLIRARYELAKLVGKSAEPFWPMAATVPRATRYAAASDHMQSGSNQTVPGRPAVSDSWPLARLRGLIASIYAALVRRATALVACDEARAAAFADLQTSAACRRADALDRVLDCTLRQNAETMSMLATLSRYNNTVARHGLAVLPSSISSRRLVETLLE